jgi:tetratricopeptide (TPR) repeat protein
MPAGFQNIGTTIRISTLLLALVALVGPTHADESGAVERALDRLANLDRDPLRLPAAPTPPSELEKRERLAIARSVQIVEAELDTSLAVLTGDVLPLLSLARNHRHLGLRRRALQWYERASLADKKKDFVDEILEERFDVALELGDSTLIVTTARTMVERDDAIRWTPRLTDALAHLAGRRQGDHAAADLARRIEALSGTIDADCLIELARLHQRRDEDHAARDQYRELVRRESRITPPSDGPGPDGPGRHRARARQRGQGVHAVHAVPRTRHRTAERLGDLSTRGTGRHGGTVRRSRASVPQPVRARGIDAVAGERVRALGADAAAAGHRPRAASVRTFTPAGRGETVKDVIARLILAYRRELELYAEVLDLAHEGVATVRDCRPLCDLQAVNTRKQARLAEIDAIERAIEADKKIWRETPRAGLDAPELESLLQRLTDRIEQILRAERETDRWIVQGAALSTADQPST